MVFWWGPRELFLFYLSKKKKEVVFLKLKHDFCRKDVMSFHAFLSRIWHCSTRSGDSSLCPSSPLSGWDRGLRDKSFADSSFLCNTQGNSVLVTSPSNSLNPSFFSKLFSLVSGVFFSQPTWSRTWEDGCYRMFSTSLRQATDDWGSHFTGGNYLRFSESLLTVGKDCFSLWECQLEPFITWMTCNGIKTLPRTHSVLSRWQSWRQCLSL